MPPEEEDREETQDVDGDEWAPEREETAPEFMEPVVEVEEAEPGAVDLARARKERDAKASTLYRERRVVEEVVEERAEPARRPTRRERREAREIESLQRALEREVERRDSWLRSTLAYKTFYDLVCNRLGVIVAGFGIAMILFVISYDWMQGRELHLGTKHWIGIIISLSVYCLGMVLEGIRAWSWECEGIDRATRAARAGPGEGPSEAPASDGDGPVPMIPEDAVEGLINGNDGNG